MRLKQIFVGKLVEGMKSTLHDKVGRQSVDVTSIDKKYFYELVKKKQLLPTRLLNQVDGEDSIYGQLTNSFGQVSGYKILPHDYNWLTTKKYDATYIVRPTLPEDLLSSYHLGYPDDYITIEIDINLPYKDKLKINRVSIGSLALGVDVKHSTGKMLIGLQRLRYSGAIEIIQRLDHIDIICRGYQIRAVNLTEKQTETSKIPEPKKEGLFKRWLS